MAILKSKFRKKLIQNDYLPVATNYNFLNSLTFYLVFVNLGMQTWNIGSNRFLSFKLGILDLTDFLVSNIKVLLNHVGKKYKV